MPLDAHEDSHPSVIARKQSDRGDLSPVVKNLRLPRLCLYINGYALTMTQLVGEISLREHILIAAGRRLPRPAGSTQPYICHAATPAPVILSVAPMGYSRRIYIHNYFIKHFIFLRFFLVASAYAFVRMTIPVGCPPNHIHVMPEFRRNIRYLPFPFPQNTDPRLHPLLCDPRG